MNHKRVLLLAVSAFVVLVILQISIPAQAQSASPTVTPAPTPSPTPSTTTVTSSGPISYDQALSTYKEVAAEVVKSANGVLEISKWIIGGIFAVITLAGGAILYMWRSTAEAKHSAAESAAIATATQGDAKLMEDQMQKALFELAESRGMVAELREQMQSQLQTLQRDLQEQVPRLITLADIDTRAMQVYSRDRRLAQGAESILLQLSRHPDPVVRKKCVEVFVEMAESDRFRDIELRPIRDRLLEMTDDLEEGVRKEVYRALNIFNRFTSQPEE